MNKARTEYQLAPLGLDGQLSKVADNYAHEMLEKKYYGHKGLDGSRFYDRVESQGLICDKGYEDLSKMELYLPQHFNGNERLGDDVVKGFLNSDKGHYYPIFDQEIKRVGVGVAFGDASDCFFDTDLEKQECKENQDYTRFYFVLIFCD